VCAAAQSRDALSICNELRPVENAVSMTRARQCAGLDADALSSRLCGARYLASPSRVSRRAHGFTASRETAVYKGAGGAALDRRDKSRIAASPLEFGPWPNGPRSAPSQAHTRGA
jgi:hypothetical protein